MTPDPRSHAERLRENAAWNVSHAPEHAEACLAGAAALDEATALRAERDDMERRLKYLESHSLLTFEAENRALRAERGYRRCDIPACNCGRYHGGDAEHRLREISELLSDNGTPSGTIWAGVKWQIDQAESLRARVAQLEEERGQWVRLVSLMNTVWSRDRGGCAAKRLADAEIEQLLAALTPEAPHGTD